MNSQTSPDGWAGCGVSIEEAVRYFDHVATDSTDASWVDAAASDVPSDLLEQRKFDYSLLDRGISWFTEDLQDKQPLTWRVLSRSSETRVIVLEKYLVDPSLGRWLSWAVFLEVQGRLIQVSIFPSREGYAERFDEYLSLPPAYARAWLWKVSNWKIPTLLPTPPFVNRQMTCSTRLGMDQIIDTYDLGKHKKALLADLYRRFPEAAPDKKEPRSKIRCFLDTRPEGVGGPVGDQFFTRTRMRDGTVYHIRNGNVAGIDVLNEPLEALDRYHEHLLLKRKGEFDFSAWLDPIE